jgi:Na+-transporting NADH:ubiquinone oxidoreductase subunit A
MVNIKRNKGYNLKIQGRPSADLMALSRPATLAALPERIPFIKPRLLVEKGQAVKVGSVLFEDKSNPDLNFLSPGGGRVREIVLGPRRVLREIVIELDENESSESFETLDEAGLKAADRQDLVQMLINGGLWPLLRALPFRDIADPLTVPTRIMVTLGGAEPFQPRADVYLSGKTDLFRFGIRVLHKLANGHLLVATSRDNTGTIESLLPETLTHSISGPYPADDPGALLYRVKKSSTENRAWYIEGQDVLLLAELIQTGRYPTERIVAVGGESADQCQHVKTRLGAPLGHMVKPAAQTSEPRYISGGVFRGYQGSAQTHLGLYETAVTLLPEGNEKEFLALFNPGFRKPTFSRAYLSRLNPAPLDFNCNVHGGDRACIACMHCADICPVDILPQFTYKAILAEEVEEFLSHGLLDCVECGLCSFVCPSKIELTETLKAAKATYRKEQTG